MLCINVISLKTHFLLWSVCSLHRPCEVCVWERDRWEVPCIPHNVIVNNQVAFSCVFVYLWLQKYMINWFSGNTLFWWVFGWLGGFWSLVGLEIGNLATHAIYTNICNMPYESWDSKDNDISHHFVTIFSWTRGEGIRMLTYLSKLLTRTHARTHAQTHTLHLTLCGSTKRYFQLSFPP